MNNDLPTSGSTRRSFIKRSVVAAVAVSTMTIFSGLVNAGPTDYAPTPSCSPDSVTLRNPDGTSYSICWCMNGEGPGPRCGTKTSDVTSEGVHIDCSTHKTQATGIVCFKEYFA